MGDNRLAGRRRAVSWLAGMLDPGEENGPLLRELLSRRGFLARASLAGLDFSNSSRLLWEAAAAVPFTAFCAAALVPEQTAAKAVGYGVMGLPGVAPTGYSDFSYRRVLSREATGGGSLP